MNCEVYTSVAQLFIAERTLDTLLPNTFTMFKKKKASTDDYQVSMYITFMYSIYIC